MNLNDRGTQFSSLKGLPVNFRSIM